MRTSSKLFTAMGLILAATPAWAVYNQTMVLTGTNAQAVPASSISFTTAGGETVTVADNDDDNDGVFILVFPGSNAEAGTLNVLRGDGSQASIAVPAAGPGEKIQVNLDTGTATPVRDQPMSEPRTTSTDTAPDTPTATAIGSYDSFEVPRVGAGTRITGGGESFVALSKKHLSGWSGMGVLGLPNVMGGKLDFGVMYGEADGNSSGTVADDTDSVGIVYHDFSPNNSTGINLGANGLNVSTRAEVDHTSFFARYSLPGGNNGYGFTPFGKLFYSSIDQLHASSISSPVFGNSISTTARQKVSENLWGLELGLRLDSDSNGVRTGFGAGVIGYYRDAKLRSSQHNICTLVACPLPQQNFTIDIDDSDDDFSFGFDVNANIGVGIGGGAEIGLIGSLIYFDKLAKVWNPASGNDLFLDNNPTHLETGSSTVWRAGGYLKVGF